MQSSLSLNTITTTTITAEEDPTTEPTADLSSLKDSFLSKNAVDRDSVSSTCALASSKRRSKQKPTSIPRPLITASSERTVQTSNVSEVGEDDPIAVLATPTQVPVNTRITSSSAFAKLNQRRELLSKNPSCSVLISKTATDDNLDITPEHSSTEENNKRPETTRPPLHKSSSWYDTMMSFQRKVAEKNTDNRRDSTDSSVCTADSPKLLKNAYTKKKLEIQQQQHTMNNLNDKLDSLQEQIGTYHELLEFCEHLEKRNQECEVVIERMRQKHEMEKRTLENEMLMMEQRMWNMEEITYQNELLKKELEAIKMKLEPLEQRRREKEEENRMEEDMIALKLELAQSCEMEDWQALRLREMESQLSKLKKQSATNVRRTIAVDTTNHEKARKQPASRLTRIASMCNLNEQGPFMRTIATSSILNIVNWGKESERTRETLRRRPRYGMRKSISDSAIQAKHSDLVDELNSTSSESDGENEYEKNLYL